MKECHDYLLRLNISFLGNISQLPLLRGSSIFKFSTNIIEFTTIKKNQLKSFLKMEGRK